MWRRRVLFDCIAVIAFVTCPWYVALLIALCGIFFFNTYIEFPILGLLIDLQYGSVFAHPMVPYFFMTACTIGLLLLLALKRRLVFYPTS